MRPFLWTFSCSAQNCALDRRMRGTSISAAAAPCLGATRGCQYRNIETKGKSRRQRRKRHVGGPRSVPRSRIRTNFVGVLERVKRHSRYPVWISPRGESLHLQPEMQLQPELEVQPEMHLEPEASLRQTLSTSEWRRPLPPSRQASLASDWQFDQRRFNFAPMSLNEKS